MDDRDDSNSDHFPFAFLFGENASAVLADTLTGTLDFDTKVKPDPDAEQRQQHAGPLATDDDDGGSVSDDDDDDDEDNKLVVTRTAAVSKPSPAPQGGRIVVPLAKPSSSGWALPPPLPHYPTQHLLRDDQRTAPFAAFAFPAPAPVPDASLPSSMLINPGSAAIEPIKPSTTDVSSPPPAAVRHGFADPPELTTDRKRRRSKVAVDETDVVPEPPAKKPSRGSRTRFAVDGLAPDPSGVELRKRQRQEANDEDYAPSGSAPKLKAPRTSLNGAAAATSVPAYAMAPAPKPTAPKPNRPSHRKSNAHRVSSGAEDLTDLIAPTISTPPSTKPTRKLVNKGKGKAVFVDPSAPTDRVASTDPLSHTIPTPPSTQRAVPRKSIDKSKGRLPIDPAAASSSAPPTQIQHYKCLSTTYKRFPMCAECTSRRTGFTCSFVGVRSFTLSPSGGTLVAPLFISTTVPNEEPVFPDKFNVPFTLDHAARIKTAAASQLLPTLRLEHAHAAREGALRMRQELQERSTCDTCLHSVLSGSWLCTTCGRELCLECYEHLKLVEEGDAAFWKATQASARWGKAGEAEREVLTENGKETRWKDYSEEQRRLRKCSGKVTGKKFLLEPHRTGDLTPLTRFEDGEAGRIVSDMEKWLKSHPPVAPPPIDPELLEQHYYPPPPPTEEETGYLSPAPESHPFLVVPDLAPNQPLLRDSFYADSADDDGEVATATAAPSRAIAALQLEHFHALWSKGETMVVDVGTDALKADWSPEAFQKRFIDTPCKVVSNRSLNVRDTTVGRFFENFGKKRENVDSCKIKDWPSTADFKDEYPDLFKDYMDALPIGSVTRRDGVLNLAAHTPSNANPPDLGPKGYFSETSDDGPDGQGSTKLHKQLKLICLLFLPALPAQDVADALNIMLWAGPTKDGKPGYAAWDLYRVEDSDLIREFLYEFIAQRAKVRVEKIRETQDDPIHGQNVYLHEQLRAQLLQEKGVKSWRIWQRPGEVVFIPAGCAHQVCNFADCIKVASDFVSCENVGRCWQVTDEFRAQTKEKTLWRSDVLQLKAQLLWAWKSCERLEKTLGLQQEGAAEPAAGPAPAESRVC